MARQGFKRLIILWWVSGISCVVVTLATNKYLPLELRNYQEAMANAEPSTGDWIIFAIGFSLLITAIIVSLGLYRFRPWAKRLLLPIHIVALILTPFYGPSVTTGWASALCYLYSLLTGGLLFLVYFHRSVKCLKPTTHNKLKGRPAIGFRAREAWRKHKAWGVSPRTIAFEILAREVGGSGNKRDIAHED